MKKITTHYDNLQVSPHASPSVIRAAYKALSQKWHPDLNPDSHEFACKNFQLIKHAFDVLSNPQLKQEHDRWIKNMRRNHSRRKTDNVKPARQCSIIYAPVKEKKRILYVVA